MRYLDDRGFRTQEGRGAEAIGMPGSARLPAGFDGTHHGVVDGLLIVGNVPARDIHRALASRAQESIRALVVHGAPAGAPGIEAALKQPYTVFAMDANGLLRPWATHNHFVH